MTDLEMTKLCAEAMGLPLFYPLGGESPHVRSLTNYDRDTSDERGPLKHYWPLGNDAQAMTLVKRFKLECTSPAWADGNWVVAYGNQCVWNKYLNRAIVECVARMQARR